MIKQLLIIRLSSIGDVLHCTPVARALKAAWPDCQITWLVSEGAAEILTTNPHIDTLLIWSREQFEQHLRHLALGKALRLLGRLRSELATRQFDAVLDIQGLFLTGMIAILAKTSRRIGMSDTRELNSLFMTETAPAGGRHIIDRYLGVLRPLGIASGERRMTLVVSAAARRFAADFLAGRDAGSPKRIVVLVPGTTWPAKNWPAAFFARTAWLLVSDFRLVLCGGKAEVRLGREIQTRAGIPLLNVIGRTGLIDMAGLIESAAALIAGDTGPLYMAAALGIPTVALFGPTDPSVYAPADERNAVLVRRLPCSFCHKMTCPNNTAGCMKSIRPEDVVQAVHQVARSNPPLYVPTGHGLVGDLKR